MTYMRGVFIVILLNFSLTLTAQQVQWAMQVVDYSSQYGQTSYAAKQALGVPNAMNSGANTQNLAWAPAREENVRGEKIHVRFAVSVAARQVIVAESKNPGAITRIVFVDTERKRHIIYEDLNPKPVATAQRLFAHRFPQTDYKVRDVIVELKTTAVLGMNQIDAIGISTSDVEVSLEIKEELVAKGKLPAGAEFLGNEINSEFAERLPIISPDGKTLYFARKYHPQNIGEDNQDDIWKSTLLANGTWSRPLNVGAPLNNRNHNFVVAVAPSGNTLYLANDYNGPAKDGISVSHLDSRSWSRPRTLRIKDHYNESDYVCYHLSTDEQVLLMSVERREGLGNRDLYVSFRQKNGDFSKPKNLGRDVNTVSDESSIFLAADGKTIYFSSTGHQGYGGFDMYVSRRLDETWTSWTPPINLGNELNTAGNEYNYTIPASGDYAYYASDAQSGMSDIYRVRLPQEVRPEPVVLIRGRLKDASSNQSVSGDLAYQFFQKNKKQTTISADANGEFTMVLPYGADVAVQAEVPGYFAVSDRMKLTGNQLEDLDFDIQKEEGEATTITQLEQLQLRLYQLEKELEYLELERMQTVARSLPKPEDAAPKPYSSDPELMAIRKKYERLKQNAGETLAKKGNTNTDAYKPVFSDDDEKEEKTIKEDDELAEMKNKFNRANKNTAATRMEYMDFDIIEQNVREELETNLHSQIEKDLQEELLAEAKREVEQELDTPAARQKLRDMEADILTLKSTNVSVNADDTQDEWLEEIKADLRKVLEDEVRLELRKELRPEVKAELRKELEYQVKKELEVELRQKIEIQVRAEIERENQVNTKENAPTKEEVEEDEAEAAPFIPKYKEIEKDILLVPIEVGEVIALNNIFFDSNKATLKTESDPELARVLTFLQKNPNLTIEVGGHTNGWCSHVFANELSENRAQMVANYFIQNGIAAEKIKFHGYGKTQPVASNESKAGRRKNQRVELRILAVN